MTTPKPPRASLKKAGRLAKQLRGIQADRDLAILAALDDGHTQKAVADETGLTPGRVGQIWQNRNEAKS